MELGSQPIVAIGHAMPAGQPSATIDGAVLWARYSYPPNSLGYCGPGEHRALLDYASAGYADEGLRQLLRGFEGAFPYMRFIAEASGIGDAFDARVVEAYWLGSPLLDQIDPHRFWRHLEERYRKRAGAQWGFLAEALPIGAVPNHAFHVFGVYPWIGRLRGSQGGPAATAALEVLDRCRIRWGQVVDVMGDRAIVRSKPLAWDGSRLSLGSPCAETATCSVGGTGLVKPLRVGDWVSLHWDWICDHLSQRQLAYLRHHTLRQLVVTNQDVAHPAAAVRLAAQHREF
jgi:hypothetical protein